MYHSLGTNLYIFKRKKYFFKFFRPKNNILRFSDKSQKIHRTPVTVTLMVTVKNFSLGNVLKI